MVKKNSTYEKPLRFVCLHSTTHTNHQESLQHLCVLGLQKPSSCMCESGTNPGSLLIWRLPSCPQHCWMSYNSKLKHASSSGAEDSIARVRPLLHVSSRRLEHQSANSVEAPTPASPTRRATAPWRVIVIWTVGPEWAGGWGGLEGLRPGAELLLLLTVQRKDKCSEIEKKIEARTQTQPIFTSSLCFHATAWHGHSTPYRIFAWTAGNLSGPQHSSMTREITSHKFEHDILNLVLIQGKKKAYTRAKLPVQQGLSPRILSTWETLVQHSPPWIISILTAQILGEIFQLFLWIDKKKKKKTNGKLKNCLPIIVLWVMSTYL